MFAEGIPLGHDKSPYILIRKGKRIVFAEIRLLGKDGKIQQPFVKPVCHLFRVAAGNMCAKAGICFLQQFYLPCQITYLIGLGKPQVNIPSGDIGKGQEFALYPVSHIHKVGCPIPQQHSLFRQADAETASDK